MNKLSLAAAVLLCCNAVACSDDGGGSGPGPASTDGAITESGSSDEAGTEVASPGDAAKSDHYGPCDTSAQCPDGDECLAPAAGAPKMCRKPCSTTTDCPKPAGASPATCWPIDNHCGIYCAIGGFVPDCPMGMACIRTGGAGDGLCGSAK